MTGVCGMTDLLLETELSPEQREFAEATRRSAKALLAVINDILDFSKMEAGKFQLEVADFNLNALIEDATFLLSQGAASKGLEMSCLIEDDVPRSMRGDAGRVRQILINLIGNAVKFTDRGEISVRASLAGDMDARVTVRFAVTDTGIGVPTDQKDRLFREFSRLDGPMMVGKDGTGLGLTISKRLAEMMGGRIGVESEAGRGSTFWFTACFDRAAELPADRIAAPVGLRDSRVLTVDDNVTSCEVLRYRLRSWGARNDYVGSAEEALTSLREAARTGDPYRIVLLDAQLPGTDGETLARKIKAEPNLEQTEIGLLTSLGNSGSQGTEGQSTAAARLSKPLREMQLADCLTRLLAPGRSSSEPKAEGTSVSPGEEKDGRCRVLLVEDNLVNQLVAKRLLHNAGTTVDIAENGLEAVEALERQRYDVVFMDIQMPEMDGYQATTEIRRREGNDRHTPIIALTAHAMPEDRERCLASGMDDYLSKPVAPEEIEGALRRWAGSVATVESVEPKPSVAPQKAPSHSQGIFDYEAALENAGGDSARLLDSLRSFQSQSGKILADLRSALSRRDLAVVELSASLLKDSLGNLAAGAARAAAMLVETLGREGDLTRAHEALASLEREVASLQGHLSSLSTRS
jgi:CheY-like chemotaxis protein/HPt (histidine-containing phosphotransfer) domain-containing protein